MPISYYLFYKQHRLKQYEVNTSQSLCSRRHNNEYNMVTDRHGTGLLYQPTKAAKIFTWLVAVYKETLNQLSDLGGEVNVLYRVLF